MLSSSLKLDQNLQKSCKCFRVCASVRVFISVIYWVVCGFVSSSYLLIYCNNLLSRVVLSTLVMNVCFFCVRIFKLIPRMVS